MPIAFTCDNCDEEIECGERFAGKLVNCPRCDEGVRVPLTSRRDIVKTEDSPPENEVERLLRVINKQLDILNSYVRGVALIMLFYLLLFVLGLMLLGVLRNARLVD